MPGINLLIDSGKSAKDLERELLNAQQQMKVNPDYYSRKLIIDQNWCLGCTAYLDYPIKKIETEDYILIIEGKIYNKDDQAVESGLLELARHLSSGGDEAVSTVREWVLETDGDYLILIRDKGQGKLFLFNDLLGRLPLYYFQNGGWCLISRDVTFCNVLSRQVTGDRLGIAEYLLFGFPLGGRTLVENLSRLAPATMISIETSSPAITLTPLIVFNFDDKAQDGKSIDRIAEELKELFIAACRSRGARGEEGPNIVALSGGLDSRAVALGLRASGVDFEAASFMDEAGEREPDVTLAEQVAAKLGVNWKLFNLRKPELGDYRHMLDLKDGLCNVGMTFILDFFRRIKDHFGPGLIHFTGDGGNILVPDMRPPQRLRTISDLVDCIVSNNVWLKFDQVEAVTGVDREEIVSEMRRLVEAYPEKDLYQKYVHFIIFEHCFKLQFEGEDRNRCYFWTVAPYYSGPVFKYLMNVPDCHKRFHRLYGLFMKKLSPQCAAIDNVGSLAVPLNSPRRYLYLAARNLFSLLPPALKIMIRKTARAPYQSRKIDAALRRETLSALSRKSTVSLYLKIDETRRLLEGDIDKAQFDLLATVILYFINYPTAGGANLCF